MCVSAEFRLHAALVSAAKVMRCIQYSVVSLLHSEIPLQRSLYDERGAMFLRVFNKASTECSKKRSNSGFNFAILVSLFLEHPVPHH